MTEPNQPSRSRTAWPGPTSHAGLEPGHEHDLPSSLLKRIRLLTWAVVSFGVCLLAIGTFLILILIDRGNARDEQNARMRESFREGICATFDSFPEDLPSLKRPREIWNCGPGIPLDQLPPEEAEQLRQNRAPGPEPVPIAPPAGPKDDKEN